MNWSPVNVVKPEMLFKDLRMNSCILFPNETKNRYFNSCYYTFKNFPMLYCRQMNLEYKFWALKISRGYMI